MKIYLDIDGVLLANEGSAALYADELLQYVISKYPDSTYWLTTHCWQGENRAVDVLSPHLRPDTVKLLEKVRATDWGELKTDAIDFGGDFIWLDDDLWPDEQKVLEENNALSSFIKVNLHEDPELLQKIILRL